MKKSKNIFLSFFIFAFSPQLYCQLQNDSLPPITLKIDPFLIATKFEIGGMLEFSKKQNFSYEIGGGIHPYPLGVTVRAGLIFYSKSKFFFNPQISYRCLYYFSRHYYWNRHSYVNPELETEPIPFLSGSADESYQEDGKELKNVFGIQAFFGWRTNPNTSIYIGIGYRFKYRIKYITDYESNFGPGSGSYHYDPPSRYIETGHFPSIQAGIVIRKPIKRKK